MSDTAVQPATAVDQWLASFDEALTAGDAAAAAELFLEDSYWRDLVAFTWNLKTVEGRDGVEDLLKETLASTKPSDWHTSGAAHRGGGRDDGVDRVRDRGRPRQRAPAAQGRQGVDAADRAHELKGHEEPKGPGRRKGVEHGASKERETWLEARRREAEELGLRAPARGRDHRRRPGRHRARRAAAPARRADDHRRAQRAPRRLVAQALQVALPARPGLVRPPAVHQVPRELAGVLAQGQDRRLARDVHAGDGAQLLELDARPRARSTTRTPASGRSSSSATAPTSRCARSSSCSPPACRARPTCPRSPGMDVFKGDQHHSSQHPGAGRLRGQEVRRHRLQQLRARHLRARCGRRART